MIIKKTKITQILTSQILGKIKAYQDEIQGEVLVYNSYRHT